VNKFFLKSLVVGFALIASSAHADVGIGFVGGTAGMGVEATYGLSEAFNVRGTWRWLEYGTDFDSDNFNYTGDIKLNNGGVILDWMPMQNGFRLSAGAMYNNNQFIGTQSSDRFQFDVDGQSYRLDDTIKADVQWNGFAPYLGIGWGNAVDRHQTVSFSFDLGVMYSGYPDASLYAPGTIAGQPIQDIPAVNRLLQNEANNLSNSMGEFIPVVQMGIHYRF